MFLSWGLTLLGVFKGIGRHVADGRIYSLEVGNRPMAHILEE
jgi:hypothetical protein